MKQDNLVAASARQRRDGSTLGEQRQAPEHRVDRSLDPARRNEQRLADTTHCPIPTEKGSRALTIVCIDDKVVRCAIGTRPNATRVKRLLDGTIATLDGNSHCPNVHSDRTALTADLDRPHEAKSQAGPNRVMESIGNAKVSRRRFLLTVVLSAFLEAGARDSREDSDTAESPNTVAMMLCGDVFERMYFAFRKRY